MKVRRLLISTSTNIYKNLALEKLIFENYSFSNKNVSTLLLWRNDPSVIIGRYQNTWLEANVKKCAKDNVSIARRESGGGAVFHDLENVNLSFFTHKSHYKKKQNLQLIVDAINNTSIYFPVKIGERDSIVVKDTNLKVSGSAGRIAHDKAYHHFTLLLDCKVEKMFHYLTPKFRIEKKISSNSTKSISSNVGNLLVSDLNLKTGAINSDNFYHFVEILKLYLKENYHFDGSEECLDVTTAFPNVWSNTVEKFSSWDYIFSKSPPMHFKMHNFSELKSNVFQKLNPYNLDTLHVQVEEGRIVSASVPLLDGCRYDGDTIFNHLVSYFIDSYVDKVMIDKICQRVVEELINV